MSRSPANRTSKEIEERIVNDYQSNPGSCVALAKKYNLHKDTIWRILKRYNIILVNYLGKKNYKLTKNMRNLLVNDYLTGKYTLISLSKKYNIKPTAVGQILDSRNIHKKYRVAGGVRQYSVDHNYFEKIDTEDKAYFLGLFSADGSNSKNLRRISIDLQDRDVDILKEFSRCLKSNYPLHFRKKKKLQHRNGYKLSISSEKLSKALYDLGCIPNKTFTLRFPSLNKLPTRLVHHFIRGYNDGDGCICIYKPDNYYRYSVSIYSNFEFCSELRNIVKDKLDLNMRLHKKANPLSGQIEITGRKNCLVLLDWLYKDATIYIERKYQKYLEIKNA